MINILRGEDIEKHFGRNTIGVHLKYNGLEIIYFFHSRPV